MTTTVIIALAGVDGNFHQSHVSCRLKVMRVWPIQQTDATKPESRTLRLEASDASGLNANPSVAYSVGGTTIELFLSGVWSTLPIQVHDVLTLTGIPTRPTVVGDSLDHDWKFMLDETSASAMGHITIDTWKDRILKRSGKDYTLTYLCQSQSPTPEADEEKANEEDTNVTKTKKGSAGKKKQKTSTSSSTEFQTADSLVTATGSSLAVPIDVDNENESSTKVVGPTKKRKRGSDIHGAYTYTPLAEMRSRPKEKFNLYGIVVFAKGPKPTNGSDSLLSLAITDMTLPLNESINFNLFRRSLSQFPKEGTIQAGDIVRIHRCEMTQYSGQPLGVVKDKSSNFILIKGGIGEPIEPYFKPSDTYSELDEDIIRDLRVWAHQNLQHRVGASLGTSDKYIRTFSQLDGRGFFDFIVAIIHIDPTGMSCLDTANQDTGYSSVPSSPICWIWDGTDFPSHIPLQRPILPPSYQIRNPSAPSAPIITPRFGSVMPLAYHPLGQSSFDSLPRRASQRNFVRLKNVPFECDKEGKTYLKFSSLSKIIPLDENDPAVQKMMSAYNDRQSKEAARLKILPWGSVTNTPLTVPPLTIPITPIKLLVSDCDTPTLGKYRIRARIIDIIPRPTQHPPNLTTTAAVAPSKEGEKSSMERKEGEPESSTPLPFESICKCECLACHHWSECSSNSTQLDRCQECGRTDQLRYGYFLKLILQDASGLCTVLLCGKEASELFHGLPPDNLFTNSTTSKFVSQRLIKLMEPGNYVDLLIQSYQVPIKSNAPADSNLSPDDLNPSQMCSQDLNAFFAPQLPGHMDVDMDSNARAAAPPIKMRRVFKVIDSTFRALSS